MVDEIKNKALALGFDLCGIARVRPLDEHRQKLRNWLAKTYHAEMTYMTRHYEKRINPSLLVPDARTVIVTGVNYFNKYEPRDDQPEFAIYALGKDYHRVLKDRLYLLLDFIKSKDPETRGRPFVDTAPVLERAWAVEAGLGWIGKNSMLINKDLGSFLFLGVLIINRELEYNNTISKDLCGKCTRCIDACPTGAILENRTIDSNKCISYLTIENKGSIAEKYTEKIGKKIFGCDICQTVCPWNSRVKETAIKEFEPLPEILKYTVDDWKNITEEEFNTVFKDSAVLRTGYEGFMRNLEDLRFKI
ncbi:MAG: tRNA epoxyqueuosine(34) reductase QueG [Bacteroidota bacterium]|nr:tRNA epoxyqueuosine(34) reductase QueG [Bacteroidota bacterium]